MGPIVYKEFRPLQALAPFIDAFWTLSGANRHPVPDKIMPDGCIDVILNTGPTFTTSNGNAPMSTGEAYLVGTMTRYIELVRPPATQLIGIRFKPGGFSFFYDQTLLDNTADRTVSFDKTLLPSLHALSLPPTHPSTDPSAEPPTHPSTVPSVDPPTHPAAVLNNFFLQRLSTPSQPIQPIIAEIQRQKGRITVSRLAKQNFMTIRRLERLFQLHLALTPKAYINFVRFQSALQQINTLHPQQRLLDIACECGYYDHAHLANEIKRYTGSTPSAL